MVVVTVLTAVLHSSASVAPRSDPHCPLSSAAAAASAVAMNDQRKLIQWSPHAREGSGSPHAQEFVVCSTSLRLFRASTQLGTDRGAAAEATTTMQPLSRQMSAYEQTNAQQPPQADPRAPGVPWNVTVRSHAEYDAQGQNGHSAEHSLRRAQRFGFSLSALLRFCVVSPQLSFLVPLSIFWTRSATPVKCFVVSDGVSAALVHTWSAVAKRAASWWS